MIGAVLSTVMVGATLVTVTVAVSLALAGVFSSSWPLTVTRLTTVPAPSTVVVAKVKVKDWLWARMIARMCPWSTQAALAAAVKLPSTLSTTLVIVTGSVLVGLVFVIAKL